jgi:hypothetical protein
VHVIIGFGTRGFTCNNYVDCNDCPTSGRHCDRRSVFRGYEIRIRSGGLNFFGAHSRRQAGVPRDQIGGWFSAEDAPGP